MRIEKLTKEQEALLPQFRDEWLAVGLSTQPADREKAVAAARVAYAKANLDLTEPQTIIWFNSPLAGALGYCLFNELKRASVRDSVGASVGDSVLDSVWASVRDSVGSSVRDSVRASVWASVLDSVGDSVRDSVYRCGYGLHDAHWIGFLETFGRFGLDVSRLAGLTGLTQTCGWYWPFSNAVILTERPCALHRNARGQLHSESGLAIAYPDGWGVYALNGVRVPAQLVTTPAESLDSQFLLKERNVEIRREFVRKAGIEKVCQDLHAKRIDQWGDYELLLLDMGDERRRPFLKMRNPSIGVFHVEGVPPHIQTVRQAINWRAGDETKDWTPEVLT